MSATRPMLELDDVSVRFRVPAQRGGGGVLRAVDRVSFKIQRGESVGLVGESGCGKTSLGNAVVGLVPLAGGHIYVNGLEPFLLKGRSLLEFRREVQMVFQDPFGSLNPRMSVGACLAEVLRIHRLTDARDARNARINELLESVGLDPAYASRYPHEFSGGQRQRIGIARALAVGPSLVIADEPVSALDVSVQAQIMNLMKELQKRMNLSYLLIVHDLAVARYMCDRVLVMYLGRIVESATARELFGNPAHPYTEALLSAIPDVDRGLRTGKGKGWRIVLKGDVPSAADTIPGCPFHPRCHRAREMCQNVVPTVRDMGGGHWSACHFADAVAGDPAKRSG